VAETALAAPAAILIRPLRCKFYALPDIITVGYRVNSQRAAQFRQWVTHALETFTKQGYVLDKTRLINGQILDEEYFDHLISDIQEISANERRFYQKITDIYATAVDDSLDNQITKDFFATVQNKMHYAAHGSTAAIQGKKPPSGNWGEVPNAPPAACHTS